MTVAPAAVDAAIVFALAVEADAFERLAQGCRETRGARFTFSTGRVAGRRVVWCVSGVGRAAAADAAGQLIAGHRPGLLITAGFAGGLDPDLRRGAVVRPGSACVPGSTVRLSLTTAAGSPTPPITIVTVDRIVADAASKRTLAAATGAQLVDMETFAVAEVAAAAGLDCAAVRVISDDAGESLPAEVPLLAKPQSRLQRLGAVAGVVARRPRAVGDLWRLWERSVVDSRTLARALADLIHDRA